MNQTMPEPNSTVHFRVIPVGTRYEIIPLTDEARAWLSAKPRSGLDLGDGTHTGSAFVDEAIFWTIMDAMHAEHLNVEYAGSLS